MRQLEIRRTRPVRMLLGVRKLERGDPAEMCEHVYRNSTGWGWAPYGSTPTHRVRYDTSAAGGGWVYVFEFSDGSKGAGHHSSWLNGLAALDFERRALPPPQAARWLSDVVVTAADGTRTVTGTILYTVAS